MPLRIATLSDLKTLQSWDKKQHVIEATGGDATFDWEYELPRIVSWREFLIFEERERSIGFVQIIDPKEEETTHYWGEEEANLKAIDIWIGEEMDLGCGYGTKMMQEALQRCFKLTKIKSVLIDPLVSNARAIRFYERFGFKPIARRMFGVSFFV
ncbi:GNAT family N-acetyltransferase [Leptospira interrogans]|uniref:GNAT family N-acetyltransferase n=1 Tax=Leptospira interrogans TaxID=173 RepID=UPI0009E34FFC|nr:GNAT family N-acetyltransferase [Leptospira interrogans]